MSMPLKVILLVTSLVVMTFAGIFFLSDRKDPGSVPSQSELLASTGVGDQEARKSQEAQAGQPPASSESTLDQDALPPAANNTNPQDFVLPTVEDIANKSGSAVDAARSLEKLLATGDGSAGHRLYVLAKTCQNQPTSAEDYDTKLARIEESGRYLGVEVENYPGGLNFVLEQLDAGFRYCDGLPQRYMEDAADFLSAAADLGDVDAQLAYYHEGFDGGMSASDMVRDAEAIAQYRDKAIEYLSAALRSGDPRAFHALGIAYYDGRITERDPVSAFAYFLAYQRSTMTEPDPLMLQISDQLEPEERLGAAELADEILASCCDG